MADSSSSIETDVELELYEEIVGNPNYTTPVTERSSRFNSNSEEKTSRTTFKAVSYTHLTLPTKRIV